LDFPIRDSHLFLIQNFVRYIRIELYLVFQLLAAGLHVFFTVGGIMALQNGPPPTWLVSDDEDESRTAYEGQHGVGGMKDAIPKPLILPPSANTTRKLALIALGISLVASVPLNFFPK
jgi:hypothetical protein